MSEPPISITKVKLRLPVAEIHSKLEVHIADGERVGKLLVGSWNQLEHFKGESKIWADFGHELLLSAFDSADLADGLVKSMESSRSSGDLGEWTSDEKQSLVRGIAYMRSIQRRLSLVREVPYPSVSVDPESGSPGLVVRNPQPNVQNRHDLIEKIQNLKTILIDHVTGTPRDEREYRALREEIRSQKELAPFLPQIFRDWVELGSAWDYLKRFKHYAERRTFIRGEFQRAVSFLESGTDGTSETQMFFAAGTEHDAYVGIREILKSVKKELAIVDSWVDETLWVLLKNVPNALSIKILTSNAKGDFALERTKFSKQYKANVEVRSTKSYHDRFIIADRQRCWHLGASIKDAGTKACLISEILSPQLVSAVLHDVEEAWQKATPLT